MRIRTGFVCFSSRYTDIILTLLQRTLRDLGILVVQDASRCTHLAAPSILRTAKFVNALAYSPKIVTCDFVTDCIERNKVLDPNKYTLRDVEWEKKYDISLEKARARAKSNQNKLLEGRTIYCVDQIRGGFDSFKSIIETNGGQCAMFRGRAGLTLGGGRRAADETDDSREVYLISGDEKGHMKLWPKFRALAKDAKKIPKIVRADWLIDIAMSQEWRWNDSFELTEENAADS